VPALVLIALAVLFFVVWRISRRFTGPKRDRQLSESSFS